MENKLKSQAFDLLIESLKNDEWTLSCGDLYNKSLNIYITHTGNMFFHLYRVLYKDNSFLDLPYKVRKHVKRKLKELETKKKVKKLKFLVANLKRKFIILPYFEKAHIAYHSIYGPENHFIAHVNEKHYIYFTNKESAAIYKLMLT